MPLNIDQPLGHRPENETRRTSGKNARRQTNGSRCCSTTRTNRSPDTDRSILDHKLSRERRCTTDFDTTDRTFDTVLKRRVISTFVPPRRSLPKGPMLKSSSNAKTIVTTTTTTFNVKTNCQSRQTQKPCSCALSICSSINRRRCSSVNCLL